MRMQAIVEENVKMFQEANGPSKRAVIALLEQLVNTTGHRVGETADPLDVLDQAQQAVNSITNAYRGLGSNTSEKNHVVLPLNDAGVPSNWVQTIGPFLYPTIQTSMFEHIDNLYIGFSDGTYFGVTVRRQFLNGNSRDFGEITTLNVAANVSYSTKLGSNEVNVTTLDKDSGVPDFATSATTVPFPRGFLHREWYLIQEGFRNADPDGAILGGWTSYYEWNDTKSDEGLIIDGDGGKQGPTYGGMTFTYPVATCGNYSCFQGVISCDIDAPTFNQLACSRLKEVTTGLGSEKINCSGSIPSGTEESAMFYVLLNGEKKGMTIGNSFFEPPALALEHPNDRIRNVSNFVQKYYFDRPSVLDNMKVNNGDPWQPIIDNLTETPITWIYNFDKDELCNMSNLLDDEVLTDEAEQEQLAGCYLIIFSAIKSPNTTYFYSGNTAVLATFAAIPYGNFLNEIPNYLTDSIQRFTDARDNELRSLHTDVLRNALLCVLFLVVGAFAAIALSYQIDKPLQRLRQSIKRLDQFNDEDDSLSEENMDSTIGSRIVEIHEVQQTLETLRSTVTVFGKFVAKAVVRGIVRNEPNARQLYVRQRIVTVMFSDLAHFTTISERMRPTDLVRFLTKYLTVMTRVVESYGGVVGEILGDGLLAFWNTPRDVEDHAALACASALAQQKCMDQLNVEFRELLALYELPEMSIRVGIHTGKVLSGNIGSSTKMKFGCLGDTVNLASRIEGLCKLYGAGIMCTGDTLTYLPPGKFKMCELDLVTVKGRNEPTQLYEVLSMPETMKLGNFQDTNSNSANRSESSSTTPPKTSSWMCCSGWSKTGQTNKESASTGSNSCNAILSPKASHVGPIAGLALDNDELESFITSYTAALRAYQAGYFQVAIRAIEELKYHNTASLLLQTKIQTAFEQYGARATTQWSGITNLKEKQY
eukprot:CAMPEP_0203747002 /NCGR_PEP_ID=MMETSP0098-20131031/2259_1 /ASSEMBLY_ACC=CAM_ASM_000208 /TAXON_ID=96639 /ORGANISM=" , Strain NY0313808BC1" /LENGTH=930 /DNA_ID=CAMNT_0050635281 /DNA_START=755 /DNA_END=3547 /DNA_ORIENTATION=+